MTAWTYASARSAPVAGYIGICCGDGRHMLTEACDPIAPAQRRLNAAKGNGKPPAAADLAAVAAWLDRHLVPAWIQERLWEIAA